jgi:hypothetical protein
LANLSKILAPNKQNKKETKPTGHFFQFCDIKNMANCSQKIEKNS